MKTASRFATTLILAHLISGCAQSPVSNSYFTDQRNSAYSFALTTYFSLNRASSDCSGSKSEKEIVAAVDSWQTENAPLYTSANAYFSDFTSEIATKKGKPFADQFSSRITTQILFSSMGGSEALLSHKEDGDNGCKTAAQNISSGKANLSNHREFYPILLEFRKKYGN